MGSIRIKDLREDEAIEGGPEKDYPAMLIGNMGVDKKFRGKGLGSFIYEFCVGLARRLSKRVGCRYVYLYTNRSILSACMFIQRCNMVSLLLYKVKFSARYILQPWDQH
jgi:GNAT superfamily N-acetyltransferase